MTKWLQLTGKNRTACIILDSGKLSKFFPLNRGRPQGDITSPVTFNFCVQILILKIELDPKIKVLQTYPTNNEQNRGIEPDRARNLGLAPAMVPVTEGVPVRLAGFRPVPVPGLRHVPIPGFNNNISINAALILL